MRKFILSVLLLTLSTSAVAITRFEQIGFSEPTSIVLQILLVYPVRVDKITGKTALLKSEADKQLISTIDDNFTNVYSKAQIQQTFEDLNIRYEEGKETASLVTFIAGIETTAQNGLNKIDIQLCSKDKIKTKKFFMYDPEEVVAQSIERELYIRAAKQYRDLPKETEDFIATILTKFRDGLDANKISRLPVTLNTTSGAEALAQFIVSVKLSMYDTWFRVSQTISNQCYDVEQFSSEDSSDPNRVFIRDAFFFIGNSFITNDSFVLSPRVGAGVAYAKTILPLYKDRTVKTIMPKNMVEGGDLIYDVKRNIIWAGYDGEITSKDAHTEISTATGLRVISLENILNLDANDTQNHLDTHLAPVGDLLLYDPKAFSATGIALIKKEVAAENLIAVTDPLDIKGGALNLLNIDDVVIMSNCSSGLKATLEAKGYKVVLIDASLYFLGGMSGGIHCMTNQEL